MGLARVLGLLLHLSAFSALTVAAPIDAIEQGHALSRRGTLPHDQVVSLPEAVGSGVSATLYLKFKPTLNVINGCVPFPAVDKNGNTNEGLKNSGAMNGNCGRSLGQIYVRSALRKNHFAVMYTWYWPKDQNVHGPGNLGHRHDWEHVVVWLSSQEPDAKVIGVSYSKHGGYAKKSAKGGGIHYSGSRVKVGYNTYGALNHSLGPNSGIGGSQPLVDWLQLPEAARNALENTNFGSATVPFKDSNFLSNIDASWSSSYDG